MKNLKRNIREILTNMNNSHFAEVKDRVRKSWEVMIQELESGGDK
jgi:CRISPR/Cas system type I-B associated protein Csh2 (Cas7 group RAMP superfamily)